MCFYELIFFPCRIIALLTGPIEVKHIREKMHSVGKNCIYMFVVFVE